MSTHLIFFFLKKRNQLIRPTHFVIFLVEMEVNVPKVMETIDEHIEVGDK